MMRGSPTRFKDKDTIVVHRRRQTNQGALNALWQQRQKSKTAAASQNKIAVSLKSPSDVPRSTPGLAPTVSRAAKVSPPAVPLESPAPFLRKSADERFSFVGEQEFVKVYIGKHSGLSGVYILDDSKKTASVLVSTLTDQRMWPHAWEHYGCMTDTMDFRSADNQSELLAPQSSRFESGMANAATREHNIAFHTDGCSTKAMVLEHFKKLQHQFLGIQTEKAVDPVIAMREGAAVDNEAKRSLGMNPLQVVQTHVAMLNAIRHNLPPKTGVIGPQYSGENESHSMEGMLNPEVVIPEMIHCAKMVSSENTSFVYHGPRSLMSSSEFEDFFSETDQAMRHTPPWTPEAEQLTPLIPKEFASSSSSMCVVPNSDGLNVIAQSFTGAMASSEETVAYGLVPHILESDSIAGAMKHQRAVAFFNCRFEGTGRYPQVRTLYNVAQLGAEQQVIGMLYQLAQPRNITPALFEKCRATYVKQLGAWRTMPNLTNVLPDALSAHPRGAVGIMSLFHHEDIAKNMTYDGFMKVYKDQIYQRMLRSTTVHGISESFLQNAVRQYPETALRWNPVQPGSTFETCEWKDPHVTVAGGKAFITLRIPMQDLFYQNFINGKVMRAQTNDFQCSAQPSHGLMQITVTTTPETLQRDTLSLQRLWSSFTNGITSEDILETRMLINSSYHNPQWCVNHAVRVEISGDKQTVIPRNAEHMSEELKTMLSKPVRVVYFLPRLVRTEQVTKMQSIINASQNILRSTINSYSTTPVVPPIFDANGTYLLPKSTTEHISARSNVVHQVLIPCSNVQFRCMIPVQNPTDRMSVLAHEVLAQYLGGGWTSVGMQVMRRDLNHCYDYNAQMHLPTGPDDTTFIMLQSEFKRDDFREACQDNENLLNRCSDNKEIADFSLERLLHDQKNIHMSRQDIPAWLIWHHFDNERMGFLPGGKIEAVQKLKVDTLRDTLHNFMLLPRFRVATCPGGDPPQKN